MAASDFALAVERLRKAVTGLAHVTEGTSYGTPGWKVGKKMLTRLRDPETVVLPCGTEEDKRLLIAPEICFTVPHYDGYPLVLARMSAISDAELAHRLARAWTLQATPKLKMT